MSEASNNTVETDKKPEADKPAVDAAFNAMFSRAKEAIHRNGGKIEDLQIRGITAQILKNVVPTMFTCIVSGETKGCSNADLRAKRLANAPGETDAEKLFNLLTSYRSQAHQVKTSKAKGTRELGTTGVRIDQLGDYLSGGPIVAGTIMICTDATSTPPKYQRVSIEGTSVTLEDYVPKPPKTKSTITLPVAEGTSAEGTEGTSSEIVEGTATEEGAPEASTDAEPEANAEAEGGRRGKKNRR